MLKIIGTTKDGFIVEMSTTDMEKLTDTYYANRKFKLGDEVDVGEMFDRLRSLTGRHRELSKLAEDLRCQADLISNINFVVEAIITEDKGATK